MGTAVVIKCNKRLIEEINFNKIEQFRSEASKIENNFRTIRFQQHESENEFNKNLESLIDEVNKQTSELKDKNKYIRKIESDLEEFETIVFNRI